MIQRDLLKRIEFAGKTLKEIIQEFKAADYEVDVQIEGDKLILDVSQKIELPLGINVKLTQLAQTARAAVGDTDESPADE